MSNLTDREVHERVLKRARAQKEKKELRQKRLDIIELAKAIYVERDSRIDTAFIKAEAFYNKADKYLKTGKYE